MATGATLLADALIELGVRDVLGIPGTIDLPFYDVLYDRNEIRPFLVRHEQAAAFMADAFGKITGRPAVCVAIPGPGATNLSTGVAGALGDSVPMIAITIEVPADRSGRHAIHDLDLEALYRPIVKQQLRPATAAEIPSVIRQAYTASISGRSGPVHVLLPANLLTESAGDGIAVSETETGPANTPEPSRIREATELLSAAASPVIFAGAGAIDARHTLAALADRLDAPIVTSFCGRGIISEAEPRVVGPLTFPGVPDVLAAADACLAVGTCFSEYSTLGWRYELPSALVRIDVDPAELARNYAPRVGIAGDATTILEALLSEVGPRKAASPLWPAIKQAQAARRAAIEAMTSIAPGWPIHPGWAASTIRRICPPETIFLSDGSATQSWLFDSFFWIEQPRRLLISDVFQTMGYAVPAAIGARLAEPDSPVVAIVGDGSMMMAIAEISAAVAAGTRIVVVVFNDGLYNALRFTQERRYQGRYIGIETANLDFARLATDLGAIGINVRKPDELRPALEQALAADAVTVIDLPIDPQYRSGRWS